MKFNLFTELKEFYKLIPFMLILFVLTCLLGICVMVVAYMVPTAICQICNH